MRARGYPMTMALDVDALSRALAFAVAPDGTMPLRDVLCAPDPGHHVLGSSGEFVAVEFIAACRVAASQLLKGDSLVYVRGTGYVLKPLAERAWAFAVWVVDLHCYVLEDGTEVVALALLSAPVLPHDDFPRGMGTTRIEAMVAAGLDAVTRAGWKVEVAP